MKRELDWGEGRERRGRGEEVRVRLRCRPRRDTLDLRRLSRAESSDLSSTALAAPSKAASLPSGLSFSSGKNEEETLLSLLP